MPSELTFRAQLVLKEQRHLYDYWCRQAGWKSMPSCHDFNVNDIPHLAQSLSLLKMHKLLDLSEFYSAGSRVQSIYGQDIRGKAFHEVSLEEQYQYWQLIYNRVVTDCKPRQGSFLLHSSEHRREVVFWLRLPLSNDGETVTDILCLDIPYSTEFERFDYMPNNKEGYAIAL